MKLFQNRQKINYRMIQLFMILRLQSWIATSQET